MEHAGLLDRTSLGEGSTVAVIGGGPAGAFFAIHFLRRARELQRKINVVVIERRLAAPGAEPAGCAGNLKGCGYSAGGISPRLNDVLKNLNLQLPPEMIQSRVHSITVQGYWKNIELEVPPEREILSVVRNGRFGRQDGQARDFDAFLLDCAVKEGAQVIGGDVYDAGYSESRKPVISYRAGGVASKLEADLAVFAGGVNACGAQWRTEPLVPQVFQRLAPQYVPPRLRKALIFELETTPGAGGSLEGELHFIEYGSPDLPLEMCSLLPKRGVITVALVGPSIDRSEGPARNLEIVRRFLELPHISSLLARTRVRLCCTCNPRLVVGVARHPFGERAAAIGDMVASRLYKDGVRSAHETAWALADALLTRGVDAASLRQTYTPLLGRFRRDNRFAALVFHMHRIVFSSSVLSRVLYQAVITERKNQPAERRQLESILWKTASGDEDYDALFRRMFAPSNLWRIFAGGVLLTLRNYLTELFFGLKWEGFGRFTTGVAREQFALKRAAFARTLAEAGVTAPVRSDFERMYTIRIRAAQASIWDQLGRFGEANRRYCQPRWFDIQRIHGQPNEPGCVIRYRARGGWLAFTLELERVVAGRLAIYRVRDGYARGGILLFEIEPGAQDTCNLSIYVAFGITRGNTWAARLYWRAFRRLFPAFAHDVVWNHSLCQLKHLAEESRDGQSAGAVLPSPLRGEGLGVRGI